MPFEEQNGRVFVAADQSGLGRVSRCMSNVGERAKCCVKKEQAKSASVHNRRRAFGTRRATRVTLVILKQMMRHASIETTLKNYVEHDADSLAQQLWLYEKRSEGAKLMRFDC